MEVNSILKYVSIGQQKEFLSFLSCKHNIQSVEDLCEDDISSFAREFLYDSNDEADRVEEIIPEKKPTEEEVFDEILNTKMKHTIWHTVRECEWGHASVKGTGQIVYTVCAGNGKKVIFRDKAKSLRFLNRVQNKVDNERRNHKQNSQKKD